MNPHNKNYRRYRYYRFLSSVGSWSVDRGCAYPSIHVETLKITVGCRLCCGVCLVRGGCCERVCTLGVVACVCTCVRCAYMLWCGVVWCCVVLCCVVCCVVWCVVCGVVCVCVVCVWRDLARGKPPCACVRLAGVLPVHTDAF